MLVPGGSGVYLYAYCLFYYSVNLDITGTVPQMLYFGYMGLVAMAFTFITGVTGYMATFWFVRQIYGAIKVSRPDGGQLAAGAGIILVCRRPHHDFCVPGQLTARISHRLTPFPRPLPYWLAGGLRLSARM